MFPGGNSHIKRTRLPSKHLRGSTIPFCECDLKFVLPCTCFHNFTAVLFLFLSSPWGSVYRFLHNRLCNSYIIPGAIVTGSGTLTLRIITHLWYGTMFLYFWTNCATLITYICADPRTCRKFSHGRRRRRRRTLRVTPSDVKSCLLSMGALSTIT